MTTFVSRQNSFVHARTKLERGIVSNDLERPHMEIITVSIAEAAKSLGISRSLAYLYVNSGKLHAIKLGRRTLITVSSVKSLVANAEVFGDMGWENPA